MKLYIGFVLLFVTAPLAGAQTNRDDLTPAEIAYTTKVSEDLKRFEIELMVDRYNRPTMHVSMPSWTPGAYRIGDYGERVEDLKALGSDAVELEITRMDDGNWSIDTLGHEHVHISYTLAASSGRRFFGRPAEEDAEEPPVTGLNLRGPSSYLYVRGAKTRPVSCRYEVPEGWRIANGLLTTDDPLLRYARDYDTFIDAPTILGRFEERSFVVGGTPFSCIFFENEQTYDFDIDAFVEIVRKIVVNQGQLFGSFPFPNYVFLFTLPGGGGLEHLNSTSIGLSANSQKEDPEAGASVTSHEFFHTWNVKRIRPKALGPFDYDRENYTGNLWVSEGWTSYFGDLTLARTGILDREEYLKHLERIIAREQNKERRKEHSVFWASRNAWHSFRDEEGSRVDYYGKGELLGAIIDLKIRYETDNRKSLNDVMRFLNRWFAERDVGFEEDDIERACTAVSNCDFSEFFARHVVGTIDPDWAEYFAFAGIEYTEDVIPCSFPFAIRGSRVSGRPSEDDDDSKPRPGETIVSVDGEPFEDADSILRGHQAGDTVSLVLERDDNTRELDVTLTDEPKILPSLRYRDDISAKQRRTRDEWLSSVE